MFRTNRRAIGIDLGGSVAGGSKAPFMRTSQDKSPSPWPEYCRTREMKLDDCGAEG